MTVWISCMYTYTPSLLNLDPLLLKKLDKLNYQDIRAVSFH